MSNSHISGYIFKLQQKIDSLKEVINVKKQSELEKGLNTCNAMLRRIIGQALDHNENIGPYLVSLQNIDKDLRQLKKDIESKPKGFWDSLFDILGDLFEGLARLLGLPTQSDRLLE